MKDFLFTVMPPTPGDVEAERRWNWWVWIKLWGFFLFALWALDLFPGFPGFARANDVQSNSQMIRASRLESTTTALFEIRLKECAAYRDKQEELRQSYQKERRRLTALYHELAGFPYELDPCPQ